MELRSTLAPKLHSSRIFDQHPFPIRGNHPITLLLASRLEFVGEMPLNCELDHCFAKCCYCVWSEGQLWELALEKRSVAPKLIGRWGIGEVVERGADEAGEVRAR